MTPEEILEYEAQYAQEKANDQRVTELMVQGIAILQQAHDLAQELNVNFELSLPSGRKDYEREETPYTDYTANGTSICVSTWLPSNYNC